MTLRTLNYGNYGIFLIMGHAGFCPSTVSRTWTRFVSHQWAGEHHPDPEMAQFKELRLGFHGGL